MPEVTNLSLSGRCYIVTGASSGIGAAAARLLAREGAALVLCARGADRLEAVAGTLRADGAAVETVAGNVADPACAEALVSLAERRFGGLDGAFDNAGVTGEAGPVEALSEAEWHRVLDTNLTSAYLAARFQIPALRRRGGGSIVFTSSFVGHGVGLPGMAAYAAAKAGLIGFAQVLAAEHGAEGIRVNTLLPGGTRTAMAGTDAAFHDWVASIHALKRMAEPEEIAEAALFLLSPRASFVTGTALATDGGNTIFKP